MNDSEDATAPPSADETPSIDVRGLGFALTAAALRALLDPTTRGRAEVSVDLSALSIDVSAVAIAEVASRVAPDVAVKLAPDALTVRSPNSPAVRLVLPAAGVKVRIGDSGVRLGGDGEPGGG